MQVAAPKKEVEKEGIAEKKEVATTKEKCEEVGEKNGEEENEKANSSNSSGLASTENLTPRVGENLSKTQRNEKKESNEEAPRENFDTLAEKEGIDVSDNVKDKPKIASDLEKRKRIDSKNKDNFQKTGGVYPSLKILKVSRKGSYPASPCPIG